MPSAVIPVILLVALIAILYVVTRFIPPGLLLTAQAAGISDVTVVRLIGMRIRGVPQERVIIPLIAARKCGILLTALELEALFHAGGNIDGVVNALILATRHNIRFSFEEARQMTLSGQNPLEFVQRQVEAALNAGGAL